MAGMNRCEVTACFLKTWVGAVQGIAVILLDQIFHARFSSVVQLFWPRSCT